MCVKITLFEKREITFQSDEIGYTDFDNDTQTIKINDGPIEFLSDLTLKEFNSLIEDAKNVEDAHLQIEVKFLGDMWKREK